jgi:hypothetical protein
LDVHEANETLRWFLREILYAEVWKAHPYYKLILGFYLANDLEIHGFWWQSKRLLNHLHRWMKGLSQEERKLCFTRRRREPISTKGGEVASL